MAAPGGEVSVHDRHRSPEIDRQGRGNFEASADRHGVTVHGWTLGTERTAVAVEALDEDGNVLASGPVGLERPDVVLWVGDVPGAARSGFKLRLEPRRSGEAEVGLRVVFDVGDPATLGSLRLEATGFDEDGGDGPDWVAAVDRAARKRVLEGREGWLFLRGDRNDAIGQHTGRVGFGDEDKEALKELLSGRREAVAALGATWLTAIVPDKEMAYAEFLPPEVVPVERRPIHDYLEISAAADAPAVYLLDDMRRAAASGDLYVRTDTHWNHRGAFVAYQAICRELVALGVAVETVGEDSIRWSQRPRQGDLGSKLYPEVVEGTDVVAAIEPSFGRLVHDNGVRNHGRVQIYEQEGRAGSTCIVFGESFGPTLIFFLRESFRRVVFVHTSMLVPELIARERAEVVINLPIERFLIQVPDDTDALAKLAETVRRKGGSLPEGWEPG
jgi:alginate O-acetyltransferase complex protein AlgJ